MPTEPLIHHGDMPDFFQRDDVGRLYVERGQEVAAAALAYRDANDIQPAASDHVRIAAFGIDAQVGFCHPDASLFVPGAVEDMQRTLAWLYRNMGALTELYFSMDTHHVYQIFHPSWWINEEGDHPDPLTVISKDDVAAGRWRATRHPEASLAYCEQLEASGKYVLTIWPYHTLLGGISHALVPALMEAAIFHDVARDSQSRMITKGSHPQTENYSVFAPEVTAIGAQQVGAFDEALFHQLMAYDRVYVFGQASSHCVLFTLRDMVEKIQATDPALARKIYVLEDAMSPVPAPPLDPLPEALDFPAVAKAARDTFRDAGMHIVRTSDPIEL